MKVLVTAGSTRTMIDQVRCISNVFGGRTGFEIAKHLYKRGDDVVLLTSNKEHASLFYEQTNSPPWTYKTYDELLEIMRKLITLQGGFDVIIHSAAVSDYKPVGTFVDVGGPYTRLEELDSSGTVGSEHECLYLKLVQTEKIVDKIRDEWGFEGILVKFKLQVNMTDSKLLKVAERSRKHSKADVIVANCLEWSREKAYILADSGQGEVSRIQLPEMLCRVINKVRS